jgi:hypothetical protein
LKNLQIKQMINQKVMKRFLFAVVLISVATGLWAQENYKYVIIPTMIPEVGKGINPYGISSAIQKNLTLKSIPCMFETSERPDDYCDALIINVEKVNSLLRNKLVIRFNDCTNREVWSTEGVGMSKDFREGYAEAIEDALKNFNELPAMQYAHMSSTARTTGIPAAKPVEQAVQAPVEAKAAPAATVETPMKPETNEAPYTPQNMYFSEKYLVDYVVQEGGGGSLVVLNGQDLGYKKLQKIADIKTSDIAGVYMVQWVQPDGTVWSGVAREAGSELKISVSSGDQKEVINLQKQ